MATSVKYEYRREGAPPSQPRKMTEEEIEYVVREALSALTGTADPVVVRQAAELSNSIRRDLRREHILSATWLDKIVEYLRRQLLNSVVMTHDRVGTKAAGSLVADLQQKVISEKRGGSGKDSGLNQVDLFSEIVSITAERKKYYIWVYARDLQTNDERDLLRRELLGVSLSDVVIGGKLAVYDTESHQPPAWYGDVDKTPKMGYHYELTFDPIRMSSRAVLPTHLARAIVASYDPETRANLEVVISPYPDGQIDLYFSDSLSSAKDTSIKGARVYTKRDSIHLKGIQGVEWVTEQAADASLALMETIQLESGRWATYYNLVPILKLCLGERHLLQWLDDAGVVYDVDSEEFTIYTTYDPRQQIKEYREEGRGVEQRFEIEYTGKDISSFFLDERFDLSRVITNNAYANEAALGLSAARLKHMSEFFDLVQDATPNIDGRHLELVGDIMSSTGTMTGISAKGLDQRGADAVTRFTFRKAEKVIREEAAFGQYTANVNLATSRVIGNQSVAIGSTVWTSVDNPLTGKIGQSASSTYISTLRGNRIPALQSTSSQVIKEAKEEARKKSTAPGDMTLAKPSLKRSTLARKLPVTVSRKVVIEEPEASSSGTV
jgi:hypothetical protein